MPKVSWSHQILVYSYEKKSLYCICHTFLPLAYHFAVPHSTATPQSRHLSGISPFPCLHYKYTQPAVFLVRKFSYFKGGQEAGGKTIEFIPWLFIVFPPLGIVSVVSLGIVGISPRQAENMTSDWGLFGHGFTTHARLFIRIFCLFWNSVWVWYLRVRSIKYWLKITQRMILGQCVCVVF